MADVAEQLLQLRRRLRQQHNDIRGVPVLPLAVSLPYRSRFRLPANEKCCRTLFNFVQTVPSAHDFQWYRDAGLTIEKPVRGAAAKRRRKAGEDDSDNSDDPDYGSRRRKR
jgi:hypothetical protein